MANRIYELFGANIEEINESHLLNFIERGIHESHFFEAKSGGDFPEDVENIVKAIVGFLNTSGGAVWIGAPKEKNEKRGRSFEEKPCGHEEASIERVRQKINDKIDPLPMGIKMRIIPMNDGKYSTLIEVPASDYPPHQTKGTYYLRIEGATRPAPHGLVEALFFKRRGPLLKVTLGYGGSTITSELTIKLPIHVKLDNIGRAAAKDLRLDIIIGAYINPDDTDLGNAKLLEASPQNNRSLIRMQTVCFASDGIIYPGSPANCTLNLSWQRPSNSQEIEIPINILVNAVDMVGYRQDYSLRWTDPANFGLEDLGLKTIDGLSSPEIR